MQLSEIQAIFWDFDGVIADSVDVKTRAFETMFAPWGETILGQVIDHHRLHGGISRVEKIDHSFRHFIGQPLTPAELAAKCAVYSDLVKQQVIQAPLIPGAEAALAFLFEKVPQFVISGTPEDELREITRQRHLDRYFRRVLGSPVHKTTHVSNLLSEFHLDPARCVFVGDALTDLESAEKTGTRFIGIQGMITFPETTIVLPDCTGIIEALQAL
ncbi:MAG: HAD family hydrolase [bacterium]